MHKRIFIISELISKYVKDECTDSELTILQNWIKENPDNKLLFQKLAAREDFLENKKFLDAIDMEKDWTIMRNKQTRRSNWLFYASSAAAILIFVGFAFYFYQDLYIQEETYPTIELTDKAPASVGARLTLANGKEIHIEDEIHMDEGRLHSKEDIIYFNDQDEDASEMEYHLLEVPKSNFFKMTLSDGTNVWVNAMSSIKFPSQFSTLERKVYLTGEAYFEVSPDKSRPFIVDVDGKEVQVLGTQFNVNSYNGKFITTLVEGKVELHHQGISQKMSPGQTATWIGGQFVTTKADLAKALSWKNNEFYFRNDKIAAIANDLSRWYDIVVHIDPAVSFSKTYSGVIRRDIPLSEVMEMLNFATDLDFKLDKNELLIKKKL